MVDISYLKPWKKYKYTQENMVKWSIPEVKMDKKYKNVSNQRGKHLSINEIAYFSHQRLKSEKVASTHTGWEVEKQEFSNSAGEM